MILIDKNYDRAENHALWALTSIMKEYAMELAVSMKEAAESQGRIQPSLIDALNTAHDYDVTQNHFENHFHPSNKELTLAAQHKHLNSYKATV